jgi:hypothetical protein
MPEIMLKNVRIAFTNAIWAPSSINGGPEKFRLRVMLDPKENADSVKLLRDTRAKVAKERWKGKAEGILETIKGDKNKESYFESDYKNQEGEVVEGFEGLYHLSTLNDVQPLIIDRDRTELTKRDGRPYSGCYCNVKVDIYAQDNTHGKGMRANLLGIQFLRDGDAFGGGGRKAKVDDFEDLGDQGEDDDLA